MIIFGADHKGYKLKKKLLIAIKNNTIIQDCGTKQNKNIINYPDIVLKVVKKIISHNQPSLGVLICSSGVGMNIAANKFPYIRAAICHNIKDTILARKHNDINILCLGSNIITIKKAIKIFKIFINTKSIKTIRYQYRIEKMNNFFIKSTINYQHEQ